MRLIQSDRAEIADVHLHPLLSQLAGVKVLSEHRYVREIRFLQIGSVDSSTIFCVLKR